jgi:YVTN family beta-propeller protein
MKRILNVLFLVLMLMPSLCSSSADEEKGVWYYLSSSGYLIRLDLENVTETGQVAAGAMPWSATSCKGHIYFSDFGSDQVFDFNPQAKILNKVKIEDSNEILGVNKIDLFVVPSKEAKRSAIQAAFEKVHKPKPKPAKYDANTEPLPIASHNKKVGLGSISCNDENIFVVSALKDRVDVINRSDLKHIASLMVGERPSTVAVNPEGNLIAISSTGLNKVFIADAKNGFSKKAEIDVQEGPTDLAWIGSKLFVLNRGQNTVSVIDSALNTIVQTISFDSPVNTLVAASQQNKLYALNGTDKKLIVVNSEDYKYESKDLNESLKFPNLLNVVSDSTILIGSEGDGRFLLLNTQTFEVVKKIQTNLPPRTVVKLSEVAAEEGKRVDLN